jgi:hypothetical protein
MPLPDEEFDVDNNYANADGGVDEDEGPEADDVEALVWNLLLLINPGDEETALRQFAAYRDAMADAGAGDEPEAPVWVLKEAIDWSSGFYVDWKDTETLIDSINQLAARWNIDIDWGGDPTDEDFLDGVDVPMLMAIAYDRLREHGYTLWTWNTDGDAYAGWMALSRDDEGMQQLANMLDIELRPGSDAF